LNVQKLYYHKKHVQQPILLSFIDFETS